MQPGKENAPPLHPRTQDWSWCGYHVHRQIMFSIKQWTRPATLSHHVSY
jgi:hypothetical protein